MTENKVNAFNAYILPPEGAAPLSLYLAAVARALGSRSDAQLAEKLNVPAPTFASWKRRGTIPADRAVWFSENLVAMILETWRELPQVGKTARAAVIELIVRTSGNPLGAMQIPITQNAQSLGGILALSEFLVDRKGISPRVLNSRDVSEVADLLEGGMERFRADTGVPA